jgi:hypothetical protein
MEQVKVHGQQMSVTNFVHKTENWQVFCTKKKNQITEKMITVTEAVKQRYIHHNYAFSFTLSILTTVLCTPCSILKH